MATVYISPTGNDTTGDGSESTPWATLTKARAETASQDTIIALAGTYDWATIGDLDGDRILRGATGNPEDVIFDGGGASIEFNISTATTLAPCTVEGITFTDADNRTPPIGQRGIINVSNGTTEQLILIRNCIFHNLRSQNVNRLGSIVSIGLNNRDICHTRFESCLFYDMKKVNGHPSGVFLGINQFEHTFEFVNCTWHTDEQTDVLTDLVYETNDLTDPISVTFKNCILSNESAGSIRFCRVTDGRVSDDNCCIYASPNSWTSLPTLDAGTITTNPQFVDAPSRDYRLRPGSPCLFTGAPV